MQNNTSAKQQRPAPAQGLKARYLVRRYATPCRWE